MDPDPPKDLNYLSEILKKFNKKGQYFINFMGRKMSRFRVQIRPDPQLIGLLLDLDI
jgi:hypothetical protein